MIGLTLTITCMYMYVYVCVCVCVYVCILPLRSLGAIADVDLAVRSRKIKDDVMVVGVALGRHDFRRCDLIVSTHTIGGR